jgi:sigma-B regulation protein RsbU (phosphoserine phosphatase)
MDQKADKLLIMTRHQEQTDFLLSNLKEMGLTFDQARNRPQAIKSLKKGEYDLFLLDSERLDVLVELKEAGLLSHIPVVVLVSEGEMAMADQCIKMGAKDYLREPLNPTLLKLRVNACLEEKHAREQQKEREGLLKIEHDVQIAQRIQSSFLPLELPQVSGWEIASRFHPARQVAGDWYDSFYLANKRRVGIVIADVCDKGVASALFMALCRSLIRAFAQQNYSLRWMDTLSEALTNPTPNERRQAVPSTGTTALKTAVELTNNYILENHGESNMFATLFFGVFDPVTGGLSYVNGGHNPPFILDKLGNVKERLKPTGPAVGIMSGVEFGIRQTNLEPGDILFTFTDGVTDAHNEKGELFTERCLIELLQKPSHSAKELLDRIDEGVHAHIGDAFQFDDITMIAVRQMITGEKEQLNTEN